VLAEVVPWQWLLNGLGWTLAKLYDFVGNYGVAIIILTILIKVVLFPLAWKQIKSMQHVQALQPKIKEIQKKNKNNKSKAQEETMRLYREAGGNPLGGCLPVLLLYPFLIAMYSVIRPVALVPANEQATAFEVQAGHNHIPEDSALFQAIVTHTNTDFLWMNLQCTPVAAGTQAPLTYIPPGTREVKPLPEGEPIVGSDGQPLPFEATTKSTIDCGHNRFPDAVPYFVMLALMVGSGIYMQRQTMKNTPPGSQSGQQQAILKYMPLLFGVFGLRFPAGLILYWTASNGFQVGQQTLMMRMGHIGPDALEKRIEEQRQRAQQPSKKPGLMERMASKAEQTEKNRKERRSGGSGSPPTGNGGKRPASSGNAKTGGSRKGSGKNPTSNAPRKNASPKPPPEGGRAQPNEWPDKPAKKSKGAQPGNQLRPREQDEQS